MDRAEEINVPLVMRTWLQAQGIDCEAVGLRVVLDGVQAHVTYMAEGQRVKRRFSFVLAFPVTQEEATVSPVAAAKKKVVSRRP